MNPGYPAPRGSSKGGIWYKTPTTDFNGNSRPHPIDYLVDLGAIESDHPSGIKEFLNNVPLNFRLDQNYPNPFNPSTTIEFQMPKTEFSTLKVYNILGEEVATLVSDKLQTGLHKYNFEGSNLASGIH